MDDAVNKALKRQAELKREFDRLETFISTYEDLSGNEISRTNIEFSPKSEENSLLNRDQKGNNSSKKRRNNIKKLLDISEQLIEAAGRPLTRTEIAEGMSRMNVIVHATDIPKYLGTLLWRKPDRFISSDGDGYMTNKMAADSHIQEQVEDRIEEIQKEAVGTYNEEMELQENYEERVKGIS